MILGGFDISATRTVDMDRVRMPGVSLVAARGLYASERSFVGVTKSNTYVFFQLNLCYLRGPSTA